MQQALISRSRLRQRSSFASLLQPSVVPASAIDALPLDLIDDSPQLSDQEREDDCSAASPSTSLPQPSVVPASAVETLDLVDDSPQLAGEAGELTEDDCSSDSR